MGTGPSTSDSKPRWWIENERIKAELELPRYEPPRFEDGTHTHPVVESLEARFDCEIRFLAHEPRYPDDWVVRIGREDAFSIGRRRDENGNTVYRMAAEAFRGAVESHFQADQ